MLGNKDAKVTIVEFSDSSAFAEASGRRLAQIKREIILIPARCGLFISIFRWTFILELNRGGIRVRNDQGKFWRCTIKFSKNKLSKDKGQYSLPNKMLPMGHGVWTQYGRIQPVY